MHRLVPAVVVMLLLAFMLAQLQILSLPAALHVALVGGVMALIWGAILHFVPVLTRTGPPHPLIGRLPWLGQAAGWGVAFFLEGRLPYPLFALLVTLLLFASGILLVWVIQRVRQCIGTAHPGWYWYAASLFCLVLALFAVGGMLLYPPAYRVFKGFHLHLNLLGFVGFAALGTLPVLLPTVLGQADPEARLWLRRKCVPALIGVLLLALGAAFQGGHAQGAAEGLFFPVALWGLPLLSLLGGFCLFWVVSSLLWHWGRVFQFWRLWHNPVAASLALSLPGMLLMLTHGMAHAVGGVSARLTLLAFPAAFLLPLMTGAIAYLFPQWLWGMCVDALQETRKILGAGGGVRATLFLLAAFFMLLGYVSLGWGMVALGMACFVGQGLYAVYRGWKHHRVKEK